MSISENTFTVTNEKYNEGLALDEYNGTYSIISCQKAQDGKLWPKWMRMQLGKDKWSDKSSPIKVLVGATKEDAIANLTMIIEAIRCGTGAQNLLTDDIPF